MTSVSNAYSLNRGGAACLDFGSMFRLFSNICFDGHVAEYLPNWLLFLDRESDSAVLQAVGWRACGSASRLNGLPQFLATVP
jgi:hypothetical protein